MRDLNLILLFLLFLLFNTFFVFKKIYALKGTLLAEHKASCIKKLVNEKEKQKQSLAFRAKQTSQYGICFTVK